MRVKYMFVYSGKNEGIKNFYKSSRLSSFVNKIPENELINCAVFKIKDGIFYKGMFIKGKTRLLIRF